MFIQALKSVKCKTHSPVFVVAMLKQALFHHMMSREEEKDEAQDQSGSLPGSPEGPHESRGSPPSQKQNGDGEGSSDKVHLLEFCMKEPNCEFSHCCLILFVSLFVYTTARCNWSLPALVTWVWFRVFKGLCDGQRG